MPEEEPENTDVKQDAAKPQIAAMKQLRTVGFPCVLFALEAREAAEQENGRRNIGINAEQELIEHERDP
jgi:hypothetical protein